MISYFPTRKPTQEEFDTCPCVPLTYDTPARDLHSEQFHEQEDTLLDRNGILLDHTQAMRGWKTQFISVFDTLAVMTYASFEDDPVHNLGAVLTNNASTTWEFSGLAMNTKWTKLNPNDLAQ